MNLIIEDKQIRIRPITQTDQAEWLKLWESYNVFYKREISKEVTTVTWKRILDPSEPVFSLIATDGQSVLGFVNYLYHRNTSTISDTCYLQDLYTIESARNRGIGKALIESVYLEARNRGSHKVYWQTHVTNTIAMKLYDKIAKQSEFLTYVKS